MHSNCALLGNNFIQGIYIYMYIFVYVYMYVYTMYKHFWLHFNVLKTMNVCVQSTVC